MPLCHSMLGLQCIELPPFLLEGPLIMIVWMLEGSQWMAVQRHGRSTEQGVWRLGFSSLPSQLPGHHLSSPGPSLCLLNGGLSLTGLNKNLLLFAMLLSDQTSPVSVSVFLFLPSVLPFRWVINQEFTVKAQERVEWCVLFRKVPGPPGSWRLPQEPCASWAVAPEGFHHRPSSSLWYGFDMHDTQVTPIQSCGKACCFLPLTLGTEHW